MIAGIDISAWNPTIDWRKAVMAGVSFAIIKATEGRGQDRMYAAHLAGAQAAGVRVGGYHFLLRSGVVAIREQVDNFVATAGTLPLLALDLERHPNYGDPSAEDARQFIDALAQRTGIRPHLYTSPGFWGGIKSPEWGATYLLWQAQYRSSMPQQMYPWARWDIWQWTSTAKIAGVTGNVDLNWRSA